MITDYSYLTLYSFTFYLIHKIYCIKKAKKETNKNIYTLQEKIKAFSLFFSIDDKLLLLL